MKISWMILTLVIYEIKYIYIYLKYKSHQIYFLRTSINDTTKDFVGSWLYFIHKGESGYLPDFTQGKVTYFRLFR